MNTFVSRSNNKNVPNNVNALKLIEYILGLDKDNRIIPNSQLYKLGVQQYNAVIKNSLIRPALPSWFCGKVSDTTGLLLSTGDDVAIRGLQGLSSPSTLSLAPSGGFSLKYPTDLCLEEGTPGSFGYSKCKLEATEDTDTGIDEAGLDWSASVYSSASLASRTCQLYSSNGFLLETGKYNGTGDFHGPPGYLFKKKGGDYGRNIKMKSAGRTWLIEDGSKTIRTSEFRWFPVSEREGVLLVGIYVGL